MRVRGAFEQPLFSGHGEGFAAVLDHLAHLADALGALRPAALALEHLGRTRGPGRDGLAAVYPVDVAVEALETYALLNRPELLEESYNQRITADGVP